jgi:hypothetical protein
MLHRPLDLDRFFGIANVKENGQEIWYMEWRSCYRTGSLMTAARELAMYKSDLVGVQGVR